MSLSSLPLLFLRDQMQAIEATWQAVNSSCWPSRWEKVKLFCCFRCIFFPTSPKPIESPSDLIGPINKPFPGKTCWEGEKWNTDRGNDSEMQRWWDGQKTKSQRYELTQEMNVILQVWPAGESAAHVLFLLAAASGSPPIKTFYLM